MRPGAAIIVAMLALTGCKRGETPRFERRITRAAPITSAAATVRRVEPLTEELRAKGFDECNPHDPLGFGPYAPWRRLSLGRILIPQKGGHTPDMGYDVLVHFNGGDAVRKLLVQTAGGVALVLVDKADGRGYSRALGTPQMFPLLRRSIEKALRAHSKDERAHVRHLAVSAWSAGTAAVTKLLSQDQEGIDAVVILDGLHGAWKFGAKREQKTESLDVRFHDHELAFARRALKGETHFVLTHTAVDPVTFPATGTTAALLLEALKLTPRPIDAGAEPFGQVYAVDEKGLHVWGFRGKNEKAHCAQLALMPRIVTEVLEASWQTPAMDRSVPMTPMQPWQR